MTYRSTMPMHLFSTMANGTVRILSRDGHDGFRIPGTRFKAKTSSYQQFPAWVGRALLALSLVGSRKLIPSRTSRRMAYRTDMQYRFWTITLAAACGAVLAYFLDPNLGNRRRTMVRDRTYGMMRRSAGHTARWGRRLGAEVYGVRQKLLHLRGPRRWLDDASLAQKVMSEAFGDPGLPTDDINVNAEHGVIVLHGQMQRPEQIRELESKVRHVDGVRDVRNYLHLPGTPPPNKAEALEAEHYMRKPRRAEGA